MTSTYCLTSKIEQNPYFLENLVLQLIYGHSCYGHLMNEHIRAIYLSIDSHERGHLVNYYEKKHVKCKIEFQLPNGTTMSRG